MARSLGGNTVTDRHGRELIAHGSVQFPVACYENDMSEKTVPWHWHDDWEVIAVEKGAAMFAAGSDRYVIREGQGLFINGGVLHGIWDMENSGCRFISIVYHPRLVGGSADSIFWQRYAQPILSDAGLRGICLNGDESWHGAALRHIRTAWLAVADEWEAYELEARDALSRLLFLILKNRPVKARGPSRKEQRSAERIKDMLNYIQAHYSEELNVRQIAESGMVSESECLRCFHQVISTTPLQYVRQFRLQKAAELLEETDGTVAEVGAECGFPDTSYFIKSFRRWKGCTPGEYRRQSRKT